MTKSETSKLQDIHLKLWKKLEWAEDCSFATELVDRYRTQWCAVDDVLKKLNVEIDYTDY